MVQSNILFHTIFYSIQQNTVILIDVYTQKYYCQNIFPVQCVRKWEVQVNLHLNPSIILECVHVCAQARRRGLHYAGLELEILLSQLPK
jgi:hypothetical protein